ncbi:hypothetical protein BT528P2_00026 [Bacteroides phage BT528P2]|nr:hypothetical protein BT498P1_00027 [Bacteroides phage BT498P1]WAX09317.1 hypothetical protein BT528P1_00026 [Bacteroides phage BT528P1]WAX09363.1 hypothetical protein BT528P2_00026 [Bacteroides phage BT528P2]
MKKFTLAFIVLIAAFAASSFSQIKESARPEQIGSYRMGVLKLYKTGDTFEVRGLVKQDVSQILTVSLGGKEQATAILQSMVDYAGKGGESVALNNPTDNVARWMGSMMGGWEVGRTEMYAATIQMSKGEIKKMIKVITEQP